MSIRKRLKRLEAEMQETASRWEIPMGTQVYLKTLERYYARTQGKEPPEYSQEEILEMRRQDLEITDGDGGVVTYMRDSPGWQTLEAQQIIDEWEEGAHRRLEEAKDLPPERWCEVWGEG